MMNKFGRGKLYKVKRFNTVFYKHENESWCEEINIGELIMYLGSDWSMGQERSMWLWGKDILYSYSKDMNIVLDGLN